MMKWGEEKNLHPIFISILKYFFGDLQMDKLRFKKLAGLLRENAKGGEQEVNEASKQQDLDFLVNKAKADPRYAKMDKMMDKFYNEGDKIAYKKIRVTLDVPVQFTWKTEVQTQYNIEIADEVYKIESMIEKSPEFKTAKKEIDIKIKQFIKDTESFIKEIAQKYNIKLDSDDVDSIWGDLFAR